MKYKMIRVNSEVHKALTKKKQYPTQSFNSLFITKFVKIKKKKVK